MLLSLSHFQFDTHVCGYPIHTGSLLIVSFGKRVNKLLQHGLRAPPSWLSMDETKEMIIQVICIANSKKNRLHLGSACESYFIIALLHQCMFRSPFTQEEHLIIIYNIL
jgi:hypothetical protein